MPRCYELAHVVGISKTRYVLATRRCLEWRHDLRQTSTNNDPSDSDSQDPCRRPAGRHRGDRRSPRLPVAGRPRPRRPHHPSTSFAASTVARLTMSSRHQRRSLTTIRGAGNLDRALVGALRQAATDAAYDGVELYVKSGWRSPEYQQQLLQEAISKYGSEEEAARWVATPETSPHVSGDAVDIGPLAATAWLSEHGAAYGLCQIYSNEPWHYELRPEAIDHGCPPMYADPTHDPRMQQ